MSIQKVASTAVLLLFLAAPLAVGASSGTTVAQSADNKTVDTPAAVVPELHHAFESVVDGTEITHDFLVRNTGNGPLLIQQVKTG
jgi:hypothetical protein